MIDQVNKIILRDSTLREGLDTPGVYFSAEQKLRIARCLEEAHVPEIEIVAPSRVLQDLESASDIRDSGVQLITSGLIYSYGPRAAEEIEQAAKYLDRFDLLMPILAEREPFAKKTKVMLLLRALKIGLSLGCEVGAGFPHSTQAEVEFVVEIASKAVELGAKRLTIYDTNGSADPFSIGDLIGRLRREFRVPIFFHGHNDLGLATANALSAVRSGASGLDVTVNGLGDRAGNAALEQIALVLHLRGYYTGIANDKLKTLSEVIESESGIDVSKLAPVVGKYIAYHKSASHLKHPRLFEAFDPCLVGISRKVDQP